MDGETAAATVPSGDPVAVELVQAIRGGDTGTVARLVEQVPGLARARLGERGRHQDAAARGR